MQIGIQITDNTHSNFEKAQQSSLVANDVVRILKELITKIETQGVMDALSYGSIQDPTGRTIGNTWCVLGYVSEGEDEDDENYDYTDVYT